MAKKKAPTPKPKKNSSKKIDEVDPAYSKRHVDFEDEPVDMDDEVEEVGLEKDNPDEDDDF